MNIIKENIHVTDIFPGDCVEHNGKLMTVSRNDIKSTFMGTTLFGDSYRSGTVPVIRATIIRALPPTLRPKE